MITRRSGTRFSLMVAGQVGSGKSTLFNSLVNKEVVSISSSAEINIYMLNLEINGSIQKITFIDTPGFGDSMNDEELQDSIVDYVKEQFDSYIEEETKIRRNPRYEDTRVHCLVYLIPATGMGLKERDISFLKKISGLANVIPVLSKTEGMGISELAEAKSLVRDQLVYSGIKVFDFSNEDFDLPEEHRINSGVLPFSCVFPEKIGEDLRVRCHPEGGIVEVDNPGHNDYCLLREILLSTYTDALVGMTDTDLYEKYRSDALENILEE